MLGLPHSTSHRVKTAGSSATSRSGLPTPEPIDRVLRLSRIGGRCYVSEICQTSGI